MGRNQCLYLTCPGVCTVHTNKVVHHTRVPVDAREMDRFHPLKAPPGIVSRAGATTTALDQHSRGIAALELELELWGRGTSARRAFGSAPCCTSRSTISWQPFSAARWTACVPTSSFLFPLTCDAKSTTAPRFSKSSTTPISLSSAAIPRGVLASSACDRK